MIMISLNAQKNSDMIARDYDIVALYSGYISTEVVQQVKPVILPPR